MHFRYNVVGESTVIDVPVTSRVALAAEDLILGAAYVGHFEADGVVSQEVAIHRGPRRDLSPGQYRPDLSSSSSACRTRSTSLLSKAAC